MPDDQRRLVLVCQHTLAVAAVSALALTAAPVVQLELVPPAGTPAPPAGGPALVSAEPVETHVRHVPLGGAAAGGQAAGGRRGAAPAAATVTSEPEEAPGYATVGVTWDAGQDVASSDLRVSVRTLRDGAWSPWQPMQVDADHAPDPGSPESATREGTDAVVVGEVDDVQVRAVAPGGATPAGLALDIVDPGEDSALVPADPAIDTADPAYEGGDATLSAAAAPVEVTPKPKIFSRAQWGADEGLRDKASLRYGEIHAGFVHHTVNANDYTKAEVPAILRGIYAYHTRSRGWSDVGYNFLVDRFGRIWEGRFGGVDRPVVGAHTLGYNDDAFAMSAIGNFETARPSQQMLDAYARLFAWKLSLHGIRADDPSQVVAGTTLRAVNGHRDAGSTACPGRYLYERIPAIRAAATALQRPWRSRQRVSDLSGSAWPDFVARDRDTKEAVIVRTEGQLSFSRAIRAGAGVGANDLVAAVGDLDGDGDGDVLTQDRTTGTTTLRAGNGAGSLTPGRTFTRFAGADALLGVGDLDGRGGVDVATVEGDRLVLHPGRGNGGFDAARTLAAGWAAYDLTAGAGDLTGDGRADLLARSGDTLYLVPGSAGGLGARRALPGSWAGLDLLAGVGDVTGDGLPDVLGRTSAGRTFVYPGDGAGRLGARLGGWGKFRGKRTLAIGGQLVGGREADLLAVGNGGVLQIYPHSGRLNLGKPVRTGIPLRSTDLVVSVGDWDGNGYGDFMVRKRASGTLRLYAGLGGDRFADPVTAAKGWSGVSMVAAVGDLTGDGHPDLMGRVGSSALIYPGNGRTGFKKSYVAYSSLTGDRHAGVGLWSEDGAPDTVVRRSDGTWWVWQTNGPGGLTTASKIGGAGRRYDWVIGLGDVDGRGKADLLVRERATGDLYLLPGTKGGLGKRRLVGSGFGAYDRAG